MIATEVIVHRHTPTTAPSDERIDSIVNQVLRAEGAEGRWTIAVVLVDDDEMQRMHRDFMAIDEPTDIMTFPSDVEFDGVTGGDLVISVDTAAIQAQDHGNSLDQELEFLIAHGMLHLLGWNDTTTADRAAMLARQAEILSNGD
jgi:probable rRNA maturation factor